MFNNIYISRVFYFDPWDEGLILNDENYKYNY